MSPKNNGFEDKGINDKSKGDFAGIGIEPQKGELLNSKGQILTNDNANEKIKEGRSKGKKKASFFGEVLESIAIAVVLAFVIRVFLFQPFYIPSSSMEPTLKPGDRIIVNKFMYRFKEPERGDIIVFKYPLDPKRDFIKRLIGLPGETIEIKDSVLYVNGKKVEQPFLPKGLRYGDYGPVEIPEGNYFMMGDNRNNSEDSREWGMLPEENIVGEAMVIYWPLSRITLTK